MKPATVEEAKARYDAYEVGWSLAKAALDQERNGYWRAVMLTEGKGVTIDEPKGDPVAYLDGPSLARVAEHFEHRATGGGAAVRLATDLAIVGGRASERSEARLGRIVEHAAALGPEVAAGVELIVVDARSGRLADDEVVTQMRLVETWLDGQVFLARVPPAMGRERARGHDAVVSAYRFTAFAMGYHLSNGLMEDGNDQSLEHARRFARRLDLELPPASGSAYEYLGGGNGGQDRIDRLNALDGHLAAYYTLAISLTQIGRRLKLGQLVDEAMLQTVQRNLLWMTPEIIALVNEVLPGLREGKVVADDMQAQTQKLYDLLERRAGE